MENATDLGEGEGEGEGDVISTSYGEKKQVK